jgi:tRNA(Ile)-lysidine synthase
LNYTSYPPNNHYTNSDIFQTITPIIRGLWFNWIVLKRINSFFELECKNLDVEPILVGVSGGPDSICLLDLLIRSKKSVIIAYFNHQLRPEADQETNYIGGLANKVGVPFVNGSRDVKTYSIEHKLSIEEAARILRYEFLFTQARKMGAPVIAVAHHADDQVETVLMHFLRGAGLSGLKGMLPITRLPQFDTEVHLIRPLLRTWRSEIEQYCRENGLQPLQDQSNLDQTFFRNRLRHSLIPELETYNPGFKKVLLRSVENLAGDLALVNDVIDKAWETCDVKIGKNYVSIDLNGLQRGSAGVQRNIIRLAASKLKPEIRDISFETLERAIRYTIEEKNNSVKVDFSDGLYLYKELGRLFIADRYAKLPMIGWPQITVGSDLRMGETLQLNGDWFLIIEGGGTPEIEKIRKNNDSYQAWLDADLVRGLLHVRGRKNGDRYQPLGKMEGTIKISDLFINQKIPSRARMNWPLVCLDNEIVWIPGFRPAHRYRVTEKTTKSLHLRVVKPGENE